MKNSRRKPKKYASATTKARTNEQRRYAGFDPTNDRSLIAYRQARRIYNFLKRHGKLPFTARHCGKIVIPPDKFRRRINKLIEEGYLITERTERKRNKYGEIYDVPIFELIEDNQDDQ